MKRKAIFKLIVRIIKREFPNVLSFIVGTIVLPLIAVQSGVEYFTACLVLAIPGGIFFVILFNLFYQLYDIIKTIVKYLINNWKKELSEIEEKAKQ